MAIQGDETLVTKGDLKELYQDKILPYLGGNIMMQTGVSDYYSEDEKIVGIWTNGKPLYQKVLTGSLTGTTTDFYGINHNISNVDIIFCAEGFVLKPSNNEAYRLNYYGSGTNYILFTLTDSKIYFCHDTSKKTWNYYLTVQYTKTTDTASTALTTPGCYDLNRPDLWPNATEIFFGNGLYGFRYIGTCPEKDSPTTILTLTNNAKIVNTGGGIKFTNGSAIAPFPYTFCDISGNVQHNYGIYISNGEVRIFNRSSATGGYAGGPIDMWFTYIK